MSSPEGGVNESTLRALFAEFKLDLIKELQANYTTLTAFGALQKLVNDLAHEVSELKLWRSGQDGRDDERKSFTATSLALAAVLASILTAVTTIVWLKG